MPYIVIRMSRSTVPIGHTQHAKEVRIVGGIYPPVHMTIAYLESRNKDSGGYE